MTSFLAVAATSSITTGLVVLAINKSIDAFKRRGEARLSVLYVVTQLELYASDCLDWLQDEEKSDFLYRFAREEVSLDDFPSPPPFQGYPPLVDWKAVGLKSARQVLEFEIAVRSSRSASALRWSPYLPDAIAKACLYTARLGSEAIELSTKLRGEWRLPQIRSAVPSGSGPMLREMIERYEEERRTIDRRTGPGPV